MQELEALLQQTASPEAAAAPAAAQARLPATHVKYASQSAPTTPAAGASRAGAPGGATAASTPTGGEPSTSAASTAAGGAAGAGLVIGVGRDASRARPEFGGTPGSDRSGASSAHASPGASSSGSRASAGKAPPVFDALGNLVRPQSVPEASPRPEREAVARSGSAMAGDANGTAMHHVSLGPARAGYRVDGAGKAAAVPRIQLKASYADVSDGGDGSDGSSGEPSGARVSPEHRELVLSGIAAAAHGLSDAAQLRHLQDAAEASVGARPRTFAEGSGPAAAGGAGGTGVDGAASPALVRPSTAAHQPSMTPAERFIAKVRRNMKTLQAGMKPVVFVLTGAFNPVHLQHTRIFYVARQFVQERRGMQVVGGLMSPQHDAAVRSQVRQAPAQLIPARHRVAMCELAVHGSSWLAVDRWECTRKVVMDYPSVLRHAQQALQRAFPKVTPQVMYLCGADELLRSLGRLTFPTVCVTRPGHSEGLERAISKRHRALVHLVDDKSMLSVRCCRCCCHYHRRRRRAVRAPQREAVDATQRDTNSHALARATALACIVPPSVQPTLDAVSSTKVRARAIRGGAIVDMVGPGVAEYFEVHQLHKKLSGRDKWDDEDKKPPVGPGGN